MLGSDVFSFSICVNHGPDTRNSLLPSSSAISLLNSATSRVVIPNRVRTYLSRSPGSLVFLAAREMSLEPKNELILRLILFSQIPLTGYGEFHRQSANS